MSGHIIWTLLLIVIFVGIVFWAFSSRRKADFDEAARLPLEEDELNTSTNPDSKDKGDTK